jgi:hypothetical protein
MTHNIAMRVDQAGTAGSDFAALADQLIQDSWHLPPEGDQSWREQDAQRIFSGHGKDDINEEPPAVEDGDTPGDESDGRDEPGFMPLRPAGILLSLALATGLMFVVIIVSAPQILTAGFGSAPLPSKTGTGAAPVPIDFATVAPLAPAPALSTAMVKGLRPSVADNVHAASPPARELAHKAATSNGNHRAANRLAEAAAVKSVPRTKQARLRPIGEAYFASHTSAVPARKTASADWKAEVARWDERANAIRARRENTKSD